MCKPFVTLSAFWPESIQNNAEVFFTLLHQPTVLSDYLLGMSQTPLIQRYCFQYFPKQSTFSKFPKIRGWQNFEKAKLSPCQLYCHHRRQLWAIIENMNSQDHVCDQKSYQKITFIFNIVVCVHFLVQTPSAYQGMCYEWKLFVKGANLHQFPISLTLWSNCAQKSKRMKTRSTFTAVSWLRLRHKWEKNYHKYLCNIRRNVFLWTKYFTFLVNYAVATLGLSSM